MARIRTIKPEMWESEDVASVSLTATLTFIGLLTQADDEGRHRDHPAIIAGRIWALRPEHTPAHVARDLDELATAGLICRYTGCDGRTYLHIVTWERHQKINRPSASRLPRCPGHAGHRACGRCAERVCPTAAASPTGPASATDPRRSGPSDAPAGTTLAPAKTVAVSAAASRTVIRQDPRPQSAEADTRAGQDRPEGGFSEGSLPGSRILDPGSFLTGRAAPAPAPGQVSAKDLVAEYAKGFPHRPPGDVLGQLGRRIKGLLDEGFEPEHIRTAMDRLRARCLHPSVLPSLVNEVVNAPALVGAGVAGASGGGPWASTSSTFTPYFNPTPPPATFGRPL
ncbi:hypothetical protein ACIBCM_23235 [Streptomyces sp. NPDC051018]|uniref:hypothetical protein n=1 Tax=Streptomyces sp. NPDC051018 TaxID=3365639 RepID=UPI0037A10D25